MKSYRIAKFFSQIKNKNIYLDYAATTPIDFRVLDEMLPFLTNKNNDENIFLKSKKNIGNLLNCNKNEIIFTSGCTESNNLAIKGLLKFYENKNKNHIIVAKTDYKCLIDMFKILEKEGFEITYLNVNSNGEIELEELQNSIKKNTSLISMNFINNETGVIQDIKNIGEICKNNKIFLHVDAAQAFGKIPIDLEDLNIDILTFSSHKIYGPKGIGGLYLNNKKKIKLNPLFFGNFENNNIRSGLISKSLAAGFGKASQIANNEMDLDYHRILNYKNLFIEKMSILDNFKINSPSNNYPGILNLRIEELDSNILFQYLPEIALSKTPSCHQKEEPSYILKEMGFSNKQCLSSFRISFGRMTKEKEIIESSEKIINLIKNIKQNQIQHNQNIIKNTKNNFIFN